ncbi:TonB family protein [Methylobacter sp.]|uniref:TonB family protein n=1 Tax=Methylobacter sp. TaxID=2051955 RepID=UPI002FDE592E
MSLLAGAKAILSGCRFGVLGLVVSLALHALVAMSIFSENRTKPPLNEELVVQFVGMVSNRQIDQKQKGDDSPRSAQKAPVPPLQEVAKKTAKKAQSPVKPKKLPEKIETTPTPAPVEQAMPKGAEVQQVQQTLMPRESEASLIRKYLAGLKQDIQKHLEYPQEALDSGYIGAPVIRFTITESGDILPGSLAINKSSGSDLLDEKALQAARGSAPMAKPPRQMTVTITLAFTQDG